MKLEKRLFIADKEVSLTKNDVSLLLGVCGSGYFTFKSENAPLVNQLVRLDIGYTPKISEWFEGYIEKVLPAENGHNRILVRELSGILSKRWPISIEHPNIEVVIGKLSELTGLEFDLPDVDYIKKKIPNFVCQGTGYQCLFQIGKAFEIEDPIWYQNLDQHIYFGGYKDSVFYNKELDQPKQVTIDALLSQKQTGTSMDLPVFPQLRPGRIFNGNRLTSVELTGDTMTVTWQQQQTEVPAKKREMMKHFPELAAGHHLPRFGVVEAVRDNAQVGQVADPFRPRYAVDVKLLDENMQRDEKVPVYRSIPLPVNMSGHESGLLAYPLEGTLVEIAFAYGRNDRPIIRGIYGRDCALPTIEAGEQLQQQRQEVSRRVDAAGNTTEQTDQTQHHRAFEKLDQADRYRGEFGRHHLLVDEHSIEEIVGKKVIEALGAISLTAGDDLTLGSLGNMQVATAGELIETIGKVRRSITKEHQWLQSPKTWVGSKQENVLILLSELMQVVKELADTAAGHTHRSPETGASTSEPHQASHFTGHGEDSDALKQRLDPITKRDKLNYDYSK